MISPFATPAIVHERSADGGHVLRSSQPLPLGPPSVGSWLFEHAERAPERAYLIEGPSGRSITYGAAHARVLAIAEGLLALGAGPTAPVLLLSENAIDHALVQLAAMQVGVPAAPVSTAYSLASSDKMRLVAIAEAVGPSVIYAAAGDRFGAALAKLAHLGAKVVVSAAPRAGDRLLSEIERAPNGVHQRSRLVNHDTIAKVLFTSGSTGAPKGIVNTQRMIISNQEAIAAVWPFLALAPPVTVDWLPWSHTFGGNHDFFLVLRNGGTLVIDEGKPAPGAFEATLANLRATAPTIYFNVPRGFDLLATALEADDAFARHFFSRLDVLFYAAAALPDGVFQRLLRVSEKATGERGWLTSSWGQTETAPMVTTTHFPLEKAGNIGVPAPGCEVRLAPVGTKLELRVKGPNVTPGSWERGGSVRPAVLDEVGYLPTGDAAKLADERDPARGIVFDGRLAENFKLTTGTWVCVADVRLAVIAHLAPFAQDAVITGHDRDELGALVIPNEAACRAVSPDELANATRGKLRSLAASASGASTRVARMLFLQHAPTLDAGEMTDKGTINQRAMVDNRATEVDRLYAGGDGVFVA